MNSDYDIDWEKSRKPQLVRLANMILQRSFDIVKFEEKQVTMDYTADFWFVDRDGKEYDVEYKTYHKGNPNPHFICLEKYQRHQNQKARLDFYPERRFDSLSLGR